MSELYDFFERRARKTILLAEDHDLVAEYLAFSLKESGYNVVLASDGIQAMEIARESVPAIDLLVTDVIMPKMNGVELVLQVKELLSDLPVIFISGYSLEVMDQHGISSDNYPLLQKPFDLNSLIQIIDDQLLT